MHAHRVEVFDRTDDHDVIGAIAHQFELVLLPAKQRVLNEHGAHWRQVEAATHHRLELFAVIRNAATGTAERERGANYGGEARFFDTGDRFLDGGHRTASRTLESDPHHGFGEELAIFRDTNGARISADEFAAVLLEHAAIVERECDVQRRLPTHGGEDGVGAFLGDHFLDELGRNRLDVRTVGELRVGHDRGRIGIHEDDLVAFFAQGLDGLRTGVIKFSSLSDHDRSRADHENSVQVRASRHGVDRR